MPAAQTRKAPSDEGAFRHWADEVRRTGVAFEMRESNPDAGCVAAPIVDSTGAWVAAMSISIPTSRHTDDGWVRWEQLVRHGAAELSRRLGGSLQLG